MTRPETQKWLNGIEYKKDQTALDRFKDLLNKIFFALKDMGFEIKSGTALSTAFKNSVVVLNAQELYESDATVSKPTFDTSKFTLTPKDFTEGNIVESMAMTEGVKDGINEIFQMNSDLPTIGTQEQYSRYLDTIFPDSKIKDIVYHGAIS